MTVAHIVLGFVELTAGYLVGYVVGNYRGRRSLGAALRRMGSSMSDRV